MHFVEGYRLRHRAALQALEGPLGTPVNVDALPQDILPWRRNGVIALMPATWRVLFGTLSAVMILDILVAVLWCTRSTIDNLLCSYLSVLLRPLAALLPVFNRMQIPPAAAVGTNAEVIRAYWTVSAGGFLVLAAVLVIVATVEFSLNPRVVAAIAFAITQRLAGRIMWPVLAATAFTVFGFSMTALAEIAQFPAWVHGIYANVFGNGAKAVLVGGVFVASVHGLALLGLWAFVVGWLSVIVRFVEISAGVFRRFR